VATFAIANEDRGGDGMTVNFPDKLVAYRAREKSVD